MKLNFMIKFNKRGHSSRSLAYHKSSSSSSSSKRSTASSGRKAWAEDVLPNPFDSFPFIEPLVLTPLFFDKLLEAGISRSNSVTPGSHVISTLLVFFPQPAKNTIHVPPQQISAKPDKKMSSTGRKFCEDGAGRTIGLSISDIRLIVPLLGKSLSGNNWST